MRVVDFGSCVPPLHCAAAHGLLVLAMGDGSVEVRSLRALIAAEEAQRGGGGDDRRSAAAPQQQPLVSLRDHEDEVTALAFGNVLSDDESVLLCTGARDGVLITCIRVVATDDGVSDLLDLRIVADDAIELVGALDGAVSCLAFSDDDDVVLACIGDEARVVEVATGDVQLILRGHRGAVAAGAFLADAVERRLVVTAGGAADRALKLWDLDLGAVIFESAIIGAAPIVSLDVDSVRTRFVVGTGDGCVRFFTVADAALPPPPLPTASTPTRSPPRSPPRPPRVEGAVTVRELYSVDVGAAIEAELIRVGAASALASQASASARSPRVVDAHGAARSGGAGAGASSILMPNSGSGARSTVQSAARNAALAAQAKAVARVAARRDGGGDGRASSSSTASLAVLHVAYQYLGTVALKRGRMNIVEQYDSWLGGAAVGRVRQQAAPTLGDARQHWIVAATARGVAVIDPRSYDIRIASPFPLLSPPSCFVSVPTTDRFSDIMRTRAIDGAVPSAAVSSRAYRTLKRPLLFAGSAFAGGGTVLDTATAHLDDGVDATAAPKYGVADPLGAPSLTFTPTRMDRPPSSALYAARVMRGPRGGGRRGGGKKNVKKMAAASGGRAGRTHHARVRSSGYAAGANVPWSVQQARKKREKAKARAAKQKSRLPQKPQPDAVYPINCGILSEHQPQHVMRGVGSQINHVAVTTLRYAPGGTRLAVGSVDGSTRVLRLPLARHGGTESAHLLIRGHDGPVSGVRWSTDGRFMLTSSADASARMHCLDGGRQQSEPAIVFDRALHSSLQDAMGNEIDTGRAAGGSAAAYARANAAGRGGKGHCGGASRNAKFGAPVVGATFVGQDKLVMLACGPEVRFMSYDSGVAEQSPKSKTIKSKAAAAAASSQYSHVPKGTLTRVAAMHRDGGMGTYRCAATISLAPARAVLSLDAINAFVSHLAIASTTDRAVHMLDVAHEQVVHSIPDAHSLSRVAHTVVVPHPGEYTTHTAAAIDVFASLGAGGASTAGEDGSAGEVKIWDLRSCRCVRMLSEHLNVRRNLGAEFSPCMRYLYVGSEDNQCYCYDLRTGTALERIGGLRSVRPVVELSSIALSPRVPQLTLGALNGVVRFFTQPGLQSTEAARMLEREASIRYSAFR